MAGGSRAGAADGRRVIRNIGAWIFTSCNKMVELWGRKNSCIVGRVGDAKNVSPRLAGQALQHIPPAMHKQQGVPCTRCPFVARSTGTVLHCFWKQKAATTLDSTISVTRPKLSSQKHSYLTSAVSLCKKKKKSVPYFSKINAIVKSWQKIKVRTTLP